MKLLPSESLHNRHAVARFAAFDSGAGEGSRVRRQESLVEPLAAV